RLGQLNIVHRIKYHHAFGDFGCIIAKFASLCVAAPDSENGRFHKAWSDVSGERTRSACWLWRSAATNFFRGLVCMRSGRSKEKFANAWSCSPARQRRALPNPVPCVTVISFHQ